MRELQRRHRHAIAVRQGGDADGTPMRDSCSACRPIRRETAAGHLTQPQAVQRAPDLLGPSDRATFAVPTLLDFARMVARSMTPRLVSSSNTLVPTLKKPGEVSTTLSARYCPEASAAAMMKGLTLEPGSKISVAARLR
jgi:hypothetical protein